MYLSRTIAYDFMGTVRPAARSSPAFEELTSLASPSSGPESRPDPTFEPPPSISGGGASSGLGKPVLGVRGSDGSRTITYDSGLRVTRRRDDAGATTVTVHDAMGWLIEEKIFDVHDDVVHLVSVARDGATTTTYTQTLTDEGWTGVKAVACEDDTRVESFQWDPDAEAWLAQ